MGTSSSPGEDLTGDHASQADGSPRGGAAGSRQAPVEVAVLGFARIGPGDPRHDDARRLGRLLAEEGWTVVTGGYGGLMAATARGAAAAGRHTLGLPMSGWAHLRPDPSNAELRWSDDYQQRLGVLLATVVAIALPGGVGTLSEAALVWAAAQTEPRAARLVLVGPSWRRLIATFASELVVDAQDLALPTLADKIETVVPAVHRLLAAPAAQPRARG